MRAEYSLWLMPCAEQLGALTALVAELAPAFGAPAFVPHVTIQGDLAMDLDILAAHTQVLATTSAALCWPVQSVASSAQFFRCLYVRFAGTQAFDALQRTALGFTGTASGLSPFPHLSLAYGQLQPQHQTVSDALHTRFAGESICFDRIAICRSSKDVPIDEWKVLLDYPLADVTAAPSPAI